MKKLLQIMLDSIAPEDLEESLMMRLDIYYDSVKGAANGAR